MENNFGRVYLTREQKKKKISLMFYKFLRFASESKVGL